MKTTIINNRTKGMTSLKKLGCAAFLIFSFSQSLIFTSCSDWTDHYEADSTLLETQNQTLWENIASTKNLSQFKELLQRTGYDAVLNNTQTYTVWAPADGTYDYETLKAFNNSRLLREFVENHVARNSYPASGLVEKSLYTVNEKLMHFNGNRQYTIQNVDISKPNVNTHNGILHVLNGKIPFVANIYESLNTNDYPIDSIANFYHSFDERKLNEYKSVQGPIVDGAITYLDSIFDEHNDLYSKYFAYINREDSNYTMLVPTNEAWTKAKEKILQYYQYVPSFEYIEEINGNDMTKTTVSIRDVDSLTEATVNNMLVNDLFYNNNLYDNKKLKTLQTGQTLRADSLYSTLGTKIYSEDAASLFEGAVRDDKSNGAMWITDSLRMQPWNTWNPELVIQAEGNVMDAVNVSEAKRVYVASGTQNPDISGRISRDSYLDMPPIAKGAIPSAVFSLPGVRSTTYSIYIVTVPANILSNYYESKPYNFRVSLGYAEKTGKNKDKDKKWCLQNEYTSDPTRVDTIYLGDFTFPIAYFGTGNTFPYLRVECYIRSAFIDVYDPNMRFDCIILRPKELDTYLKEHPEYKYDRGNY
jgi:uncharacterized surface protein with fasciclin (FAS1) repeats